MGEDFFENLRQTITGTAEVVGKRTEEIVEIQKLRSRIRTAQRNIEAGYTKLGELIYLRFVDGEQMDGEVAQICDEIMEYQKKIALCKEDLAEKKGQNICPVCGSANPKDAAYCMKCGTMLAVDDTEEEEIFTAGPVREQTQEEAEKEVWEACTEAENEPESETGVEETECQPEHEA